jgi:uncharacterized protein (DUF427 family)
MKPNHRITPGPGQESVWDYPRPPRVESEGRRVRVLFNGETIADSTAALRVLETSHPPGIYIPPADVATGFLHQIARSTVCEFKGRASYWDVRVGERVAPAAVWAYLGPLPAYHRIAGYLSFYPGRMDACYLDDEQVQAQAGDFYGGWITAEIVGPFKGGAGTMGW